ncbi:MAG: DUF3810 family protein [Flavobacteriales bacterium]
MNSDVMSNQSKGKHFFFQRFHLFAFAIAVLLFQIGKLKPEWVKDYYLNGFYSTLQQVHFTVFSQLPFDLTDLLLVLLAIKILRSILKKKHETDSKSRLLRTVRTICILGTWFLILWGYNYAGANFQEKVGFETSESPPDLSQSIEKCLELYSLLPNNHFNDGVLLKSDITRIDECINTFFGNEFPEYQHQATIKTVSKKGWLRSLGISGIYFPYTLQGHVDASYTRHQLIFTCAHELSHAHGITDEGEANLIAYLSLVNSPNEEFQFAAEFTLLRYIAQSEEVMLTLPQELINAYENIKINREKHPTLFPALSSASNNLYLKIMGVEDGVLSYNSFPLLLQGYNKR